MQQPCQPVSPPTPRDKMSIGSPLRDPDLGQAMLQIVPPRPAFGVCTADECQTEECETNPSGSGLQPPAADSGGCSGGGSGTWNGLQDSERSPGSSLESSQQDATMPWAHDSPQTSARGQQARDQAQRPTQAGGDGHPGGGNADAAAADGAGAGDHAAADAAASASIAQQLTCAVRTLSVPPAVAEPPVGSGSRNSAQDHLPEAHQRDVQGSRRPLITVDAHSEVRLSLGCNLNSKNLRPLGP